MTIESISVRRYKDINVKGFSSTGYCYLHYKIVKNIFNTSKQLNKKNDNVWENSIRREKTEETDEKRKIKKTE